MLYVTTRNNGDIFTANHALNKNRAEDGGAYVPFKLPRLDFGELKALPFNHRVAKVLNLLFGTRITGWEVDFAIGRQAVRIEKMPHRVMLGQMWHNSEGCFDSLRDDLVRLIRNEEGATEWAEIGIRMACLAALLAEVCVDERSVLDVAVPSGDFSAVMAAWYCRAAGLPVGNIVVGCCENAALWDLICKGELRTGQIAVSTVTPLCDQIVPRNLERLVFACGGNREVMRYLDACRTGEWYYPGNDVLSHMRKGLHIRVVGEKRVVSTIPNVYTANGHIFGPYDALSYSAVLDYRAATGDNRPALILSDRCPSRDLAVVAGAMGISEEMLLQRLR